MPPNFLESANKGHSNSEVKRRVGVGLNTVKRWRNRWESAYDDLIAYENTAGSADFQLSEYRQKIIDVLGDAQRSGAPKRIAVAQEQQIIALACDKPEQHGLPHTTWTHELLQQTAIKKQVIDKISARQVGRILKK